MIYSLLRLIVNLCRSTCRDWDACIPIPTCATSQINNSVLVGAYIPLNVYIITIVYSYYYLYTYYVYKLTFYAAATYFSCGKLR